MWKTRDKVHVIQEVVGGAAYEPTVFKDKSRADKFYVDLVNEYYEGHAPAEDYAPLNTVSEARQCMDDGLVDENVEILYWEAFCE